MPPNSPHPDHDVILAHPSVRRVTEALASAGIEAPIVVLDGAARTAPAAAAYLGIDVGQIANSLVFAGIPAGAADDQTPVPVLVLTSGAHRVDPKVAAAALGLRTLGRADADFVRQHTGFAIGGVAPVGHVRPVLTAVDRHLEQYAGVWAAGGHPRTVFETSFAELVQLTNGRPITVS